MKFQSSAARSAYQARHKRGVKPADVRIDITPFYLSVLNQRYIRDACVRVEGIEDDSVIFGGRKNWDKLVKGVLSRKDWQLLRNNQLYSRGEVSHQGNANIRIVGNELWVNDPSQRNVWIKGKLFVPKKFFVNQTCYDSRLCFREGKFSIVFSWEVDGPQEGDISQGTIGVDCNTDGVALTETDTNGNLLKHVYLSDQKLLDAGKGKVRNSIGLIAKAAVALAKQTQKPIVLEQIKIKKPNTGSKIAKRKKGRFVSKQLPQVITSRAVREGIGVVFVEPAFSSVLGKLKYRKMYSLSGHNAAALLLARRGQGFGERQDFTVTPGLGKGNKFHLAGRGFEHTLSGRAYSWMQDCFLHPKSAILPGSDLAPGERPGKESRVSEILTSKSSPITGRTRRQEMERFFSLSLAGEMTAGESG